MSVQTMIYTPGTLVWWKVANGAIWLPGEIIDPSIAPKKICEEVKPRKKVLTVVYFEENKTFEPVYNMNNVLPYSCSEKLEFIEKGYKLYKKQEKSGKSGWLNMAHFLENIIKFEEKINGDVNIFDQIEKNILEEMQRKKMVKGLFKKKNGKKVIKSGQSLPSLNTPKNLGVSLTSQETSTPEISSTENLRRHVAGHKVEMINKSTQTTIEPSKKYKKCGTNNNRSGNKALFSLSRKRKNQASTRSVKKVGKLQDESLKDLDLDDTEEESNENIDIEKDNVDNKRDPQSSKLSENKIAKVDVQSEVKTPGTIFDLDKEDDNTGNDNIPDLRKSMSDDNSYLDDEGNNENCSKELFNTNTHEQEKAGCSLEEHPNNKIDGDINNGVLISDSNTTQGISCSERSFENFVKSVIIKPKRDTITDEVERTLKDMEHFLDEDYDIIYSNAEIDESEKIEETPKNVDVNQPTQTIEPCKKYKKCGTNNNSSSNKALFSLSRKRKNQASTRSVKKVGKLQDESLKDLDLDDTLSSLNESCDDITRNVIIKPKANIVKNNVQRIPEDLELHPGEEVVIISRYAEIDESKKIEETPKNVGVSLTSELSVSPKLDVPTKIQEKGYCCYVKDGCTYRTTRYENLKRHVAGHGWLSSLKIKRPKQ